MWPDVILPEPGNHQWKRYYKFFNNNYLPIFIKSGDSNSNPFFISFAS